MADPGTVATDIQVAEIEKELKAVYNKAYKDILQKQKEFQAKYQAKDVVYQKKLANGEITNEQYRAWLKGQVFQGEQWQAKKKQMLDTIYNTNAIATEIINGKMSGVFAGNANYMAYSLEKSVGISFGFGLYDSATVVNLIKNNPTLLPPKKLDPVKDKAWNNKKINRAIALGIVEGESLDKIATRLADVTSSANFNSMRTMARTAMTGAQNAGREFSLQEAVGLDIKVKKEWMATLDEVTRLMHRELDGQKQDPDKPFEVGGLKIRYPGDPTAKGMLVYNCRCTMVGDVEDYPSEYERYDNIEGVPIKNMTYKEWEAEKAKLAEQAENSIWMLDESQAADLISLFSGKKMSHLYNEMRELDTKTATAFYNELKSMGKPSEIWQQYLDGTLPSNIDTSRLNGILQSYAEKKGLIIPKRDVPAPPTGSTLKEIFGGKKMSNVFNEIKSVDKTIANQFYKELGKMGKPSDIWQQYLDGKLTDDQKKIIEDILTNYANKAGIKIKPAEVVDIFNPKEIFSGKKMSNVFNELKTIDSKTANEFYKELKKLGKPSEVWEQYINGTLKSDKLDSLLKPHFGKTTPKTPIVPKTKAKTKTKATPEAVINKVKGNFQGTFYDEIIDAASKYDEKLADDIMETLMNISDNQRISTQDVWGRYLLGKLSPADAAKIDVLIAKYAEKAGISIDKITKMPKIPDRNWIEKMIANDKFKTNSEKSKEIRTQVIDEVMKTPENYRKCFINTLSKVKLRKDRDKAYYQDGTTSIAIDLDAEFKMRKSFSTLFHENGHAMDYAYMYLRNPTKNRWSISSKERTSQLPNFLSAIEKDLDNLSKNLNSMDYHIDMWNDDSAGVQDFISALKPLNDQGPRAGKIPSNLLNMRYNWHHSYEYYTRKADPMIDAASELFANISGAYASPNEMRYMKKYFPNAVKEFDNIIDEMAKMIKM